MTTVAESTTAAARPAFASILAGAIAGLGGGMVFGMMMAMMGMLPMVAGLVGSASPIVGMLVHLVISAGIGGAYGLVATRLPRTAGSAVLAGAANGVVWWVLGALILMPLLLGMPTMVFQVGQTQWLSLMGHLIYGVVTGLLYLPLSRRR